MKRNTQEAAPCVSQVAYKMGEITYVPHYRNDSIYIGPGYPKQNQRRYSAFELVSLGAIPITTLLWHRAGHGIVTDNNP